MSRDASQSPVIADPRVSEPASMLEGFAMNGPFFVIGTCCDRDISVDPHFHIFRFQNFEVRIGISSKGYLFCLADHAAVGFSQDQIV
jgi:hypothetical protein